MKILNIHGYQGNAANSAYEALRKCNFDIISLQIDYDRTSPESVMQLLNSQFTNNFCNAVVGTSLGGFFAALISAKNECPCVLVNPCLMPFLHLPRIGYQNDDGVLEYIRLFSGLADVDGRNVSTIIGGQDELIDTHDFTQGIFQNERYIVVPDGKHSGSTMPLDDIFRDHIDSFFTES